MGNFKYEPGAWVLKGIKGLVLILWGTIMLCKSKSLSVSVTKVFTSEMIFKSLLLSIPKENNGNWAKLEQDYKKNWLFWNGMMGTYG